MDWNVLGLKFITKKIFNDWKIKIYQPTIACIIGRFYFKSSYNTRKSNYYRTLATRKMYAEEFILLTIKYSVEQYVFSGEVGFTVSMKSSFGRSLEHRLFKQLKIYDLEIWKWWKT